MKEIFITRLVELLEEKNMTQLELSQLVGTTNVTISRYINGQRKPRIEIVAKIAEVLGTSVDYLLGYSNVKNFSANTRVSSNLVRIQEKLNSLGIFNSKDELSDAQIDIIVKLIDANKTLIENQKQA